MPTVRDTSGRQWIVEEIGLAGNAINLRPTNRLPEPTLATLRVTSGDEKFVVSIGRAWRELSNDDLWKRLDDARKRKQRHDFDEDYDAAN